MNQPNEDLAIFDRALGSKTGDPTDRRALALSADAWNQLGDLLDRPTGDKPRIAALLTEKSVPDVEQAMADTDRAAYAARPEQPDEFWDQTEAWSDAPSAGFPA